LLPQHQGQHAAAVTGKVCGNGLVVVPESVSVARADQQPTDFARFSPACEATGVKHLAMRVDLRHQIVSHAAME
jgi:hypothetical protein